MEPFYLLVTHEKIHHGGEENEEPVSFAKAQLPFFLVMLVV